MNKAGALKSIILAPALTNDVTLDKLCNLTDTPTHL